VPTKIDRNQAIGKTRSIMKGMPVPKLKCQF